MADHLGGKKLAQVAFVTRDIETAITRWAALLGVERPPVIETQPGSEVNMTYRGAPSDARAKLAFFDLGGVQLELIEPIGEESAWYEPLKGRGEGFHHLAFWVEGMAQHETFLAGQEIPLIHRGDVGEGQYAYFDGDPRLGAVIELLEEKR